MNSETIRVIGHHKLIDDHSLIKSMYKSLKWSTRLRRRINIEELEQAITHKKLIYHPLWVAKLLVIAERKPFNPKKIPMMAFIDGVSGYRGLFGTNPHIVSINHDPSMVKNDLIIKKDDDVLTYIKDIQQKQINRSYILKKPNHKTVDYFLAYLPMWLVDVEHEKINKRFIINGNTGESEHFMAGLWKTKEKLIV